MRVTVVPEDLLGQKSALFGMTRTGKSNTTKIIAKAVFDLRYGNAPRRVGQIIFDPNGEYANANAQDAGGEAPNALKNVWRAHEDGVSSDVVTYGILPHPNDPNRQYMLLNFHVTENLPIGKEIIDNVLPARDSKYIQNFQQVRMQPLESGAGFGDQVRYGRRVLAYRTLLVKAGLDGATEHPPSHHRAGEQVALQSEPDPSSYEHRGARVRGRRAHVR